VVSTGPTNYWLVHPVTSISCCWLQRLQFLCVTLHTAIRFFVCHNMNSVGFGFKLYSVSPYLRLLPLQSWTSVYSIWCHHVLKHWQFCCFFPETHVKPILGTVFTGFAIPAGWRGVRGTHSRWNGIGLDCGSSVCCRHPHFADCSTHRLHSVIDVIINCSDTVLMEFHIDRPI